MKDTKLRGEGLGGIVKMKSYSNTPATGAVCGRTSSQIAEGDSIVRSGLGDGDSNSAEKQAKLAATTRDDTDDSGHPIARCTASELADEMRVTKTTPQISSPRGSEILARASIRKQRIDYRLDSKDRGLEGELSSIKGLENEVSPIPTSR